MDVTFDSLAYIRELWRQSDLLERKMESTGCNIIYAMLLTQIILHYKSKSAIVSRAPSYVWLYEIQLSFVVVILHYKLYSFVMSFVMSSSDTCATWRDSFVIISCTIYSLGDTLIQIIISHIHTHSHTTSARVYTYMHAHHYLYIHSSIPVIILNLEYKHV